MGGWPYVGQASEPVFGPDGTVYLLVGERDEQGELRQSVVAVDNAGRVKPGWPVAERAGSVFGSPKVGPGGSVFLEECGGPVTGCVLHQLAADGREVVGWPFEMPPEFACPGGRGICTSVLDFGPDDAIYVTGWREAGGQQAIAVEPSGQLRRGWPAAPGGPDVWWSNGQVGSDGTLYFLGQPDDGIGPSFLAALDPDGNSRTGWPVSLPYRSDYVPGPNGSVVVWSLIDDVGELCSNPRRTLFTVLGSDGRSLPGWPRGSTGYASNPIVDPHGTVYYVSAKDNVYAHDRTGEVKAGWPVAVPGAIGGCGPASPYLGPDGTVYVLADDESGGVVAARSQDGQTRAGWPYRATGRLGLPCLDTDCPGHHARPAFASDGTVYLVAYRTDPDGTWLEVVAVDQRGHLKPGWPYRLPIDPTALMVDSLTVSPDGRLFVRAGYSHRTLLLALDPDGRISE